jgi:hypothetical protein
LSETSYDALGRPERSALRMDPSRFSLTTNACIQSYQLSGVAKTFRNAAGEVTQQRSECAVSLTPQTAPARLHPQPRDDEDRWSPAVTGRRDGGLSADGYSTRSHVRSDARRAVVVE